MIKKNSDFFGGGQARSMVLPAQLLQYGVALLSVLLTLLTNFLFSSYLQSTPTFLFFAAVMVSAWYGGLLPGLLATVLSTLVINYFYSEPVYQLSMENFSCVLQISVFVLAVTLINSLKQDKRAAQQKAEANLQALRQSEAQFSCLAESNIIGMIVTELDGVIKDANDYFLQMVGYTAEELRAGQLNWLQMTASESLEISNTAVKELLTTGVCKPFEKKYIRKDGSRIAVLYGAVMTGKTTITGFVLDLSERKLVETIQQEALLREQALNTKVQAANAQLETVLASIKDQFFVLDRQWRYIYVNDLVIEVVGKSKEELLGNCIWELFPDTVGNRFYKELHRAAAEQQIIQFEYFYSSCQRWFENRIYPSPTGVSILVTDITDRKRAEQSQERTNQTLQTLVDVCPVAIAFLDPQGIVKLWNRAAERIFGWSAEEVIGKFMPSVPHRQEEFRSSIQTVLNGRSLDGLEAQHQRKDGKIIDLEIWANLTYDAEGNAGCLGIAWDITERKQAIEALRQSELRFQTLVGNIPGMIYRYAPGVNGAATFTYVSSGSRELVELEPETIVQKADSFLRLIHPDDLPSFQESVALAVKNSLVWQWEGRVITPSGQLKWIQGHSRPQHSEFKEVWDGLFLDITERKQAEVALRQSEERLRVALKNSPITVFNQDLELRYTWLHNPAFEYRTAEIIGKKDRDLLLEKDAAVLTRIKRQVLETGNGVREEVKLTINGCDYYYDLTVEPLLDVNGETVGITCASIDMTERKQMELALRQSETTLNALIASTPMGIALFDQDLRYLHVNENLAAINGLPLKEHLGRTFWEVLPEWAPVIAPILQQVMETQEPLLNQEVVGATHPSDLVRHALVNYFPVCLSDGKVLGVGVTSFDITERRRIEESLRQSEERYRAIYDQVIIGIYQVDLTGKFISVNERFCEIVGRSQEELLTLRMQDISHPDDLLQKLVLFEQMVQDGTSFEVEKRYVRPDDSIVWVRNYVSLIRDAADQPQCAVTVTEDITQQKQAEVALNEQRQLLETILKYTADAIIVCDASGELTFANPEARRLAQQDPEDLTLDLALLDWGSAYDVEGKLIPQENYQISKALRGQISNAFESRMVRADGSYYDILVSAAPLLKDGQIVGAVASFIDVSDRKRVEEERERFQQELQQTLQTLRTLIQASPLPIVLIEPHLTVKLWNSAAERLFGWSEAEVLGQLLPVIPPEKQEECRQLREAVINGQVFFCVETYRCKRDGSKVILSISAAPLYDEYDKVNAILLIFQDITQRQQAEAKLRDSEERLRLALMAANQGLYDLNVQTGEAIVSPEYAQMLGYDADEFEETNAKWRGRLHPDDVSVVDQAYQDYVGGKIDSYRVEFRQQSNSGDWKWILSVGKIIGWDSEGKPLRMLGTHTDITERKQAEVERELLLAREKTAREQAETANRIKDEFLAVLSHELRSPLNPILGWSKLLQTRKLDEQKTQQALATIERNAKLQTQLIEDLLDVSRIMRGKLLLNIAPVSITNTIEAALETVRLATEAKGISIERKFNLDIDMVMGDAARLQQVIWNLLTNAVKFTFSGGKVEILLEQVDKYVQIQVRDTGKGIGMEFLPYVFDYFRQEDGTTTRKFGGLGLGLAIVRHITELHGGSVWAESLGEGMGATFTVQLPLMPAALTVDEKEELKRNVSLAGLRVLAIDDDADIRGLMEFILQQAGADVRVVSSATEALQELEVFLPEILISDVGMPDFDGYMLMRKIRSLTPKLNKIPAIALTAYAGEIDRQQAIAAGFQMHLSKPVEPENLLDAISILVANMSEG